MTLTLRCRHTANVRKNSFISDRKATELAEALGLEPLGDPPGIAEMCIAVRTELFDRAVTEFAIANPGGVVITLGVGLCTRFDRLQDLGVNWADIDLPEVAAIREALLPPNGRRAIVPASVLSLDWRERISKDFSDAPKLFVLEGLTVYFTEQEVRDLLIDLAERFPGAELLVEAMGAISARAQHKTVRPSGARFHWGVNDFAIISRWSPKLALLDTWYLIDYRREHWSKTFRLLRPFKIARAQMKIGRFAVKPQEEACRTLMETER